MNRLNYFVISISSLLLTICCGGQSSSDKTTSSSDSSKVDEERKIETVSESNTDLASVANIDRPKTSKIISSKFPIEKLFGIWTYDPTGPHADFVLDKEKYFIVDYDGDGDMPYILNHDTLTVYFNDTVSKGLIKKATKDSLTVSWDSREDTYYVRWKQ